MFGKFRSRRGRALTASSVVLGAVALLVVFSGSAAAAESPPENLVQPSISPSAPHLGYQVTASKGEWKSEGPAYWYDEGVKMTEGKRTELSAPAGPITLKFKIGGSNTFVTCQVGLAKAGVENPTGGGYGTGSASLSFSSCSSTPGTCTVASSAAVLVNLNLVSYNNKTEVAITPQSGSTFATWTFNGEACPLKGTSANLTGVLRGPYSNAASRIEYGPDTIAGEELKYGTVPAREASGSVVFKTTAGHSVGADTVGYQYSWSRCAGGCSTIPGATQSTYTPVEADLGSTLIVAVTATNKYGSTTAYSQYTSGVTHGLSWYACEEGKGSGYEDSFCSKANAKGPFSWQRVESKPISASGGGANVYIRWFPLKEVSVTVKCYSASDSGTLTSSEVGARIKGFTFNGSECLVLGAECKVTGSKLSFNTLAGTSPDVGTKEIKHEVSFEAEGSTPLVSFELTNCVLPGLNRTWVVGGSFASQMEQTSWLHALPTETGKTLKLWPAEGGTVFPAEMEAWIPLLSEGKNQVKLDTHS